MVTEPTLGPEAFQHEAFFYDGERDFVAGATAFLREGLHAHEPALVVVSQSRIDLLRKRLKADAGAVVFANMATVGANPARIIPAWTEFVRRFPGRPIRGIGEPIWAGRSPAELVECQHHESLLNLAFAGHSRFTLMCPYDTGALDAEVLTEACRSHPIVRRHGVASFSDEYRGTEGCSSPFTQPLSPVPAGTVEVGLQVGLLSTLRVHVLDRARKAGLDDGRARDAVTAVNEAASNALRHGSGRGVLRVWTTSEALVCEVSNDGYIDNPLVGRIWPELDSLGGRGLWMVNQLCELVQVRSLPSGTTVRMHLVRPSDAPIGL
jgi:anti-sigma regulatory factor (Ser/Thr protein kinase)